MRPSLFSVSTASGPPSRTWQGPPQKKPRGFLGGFWSSAQRGKGLSQRLQHTVAHGLGRGQRAACGPEGGCKVSRPDQSQAL